MTGDILSSYHCPVGLQFTTLVPIIFVSQNIYCAYIFLTEGRAIKRLCQAKKLGYFFSASTSSNKSLEKPSTTRSQGIKTRSAYVLLNCQFLALLFLGEFLKVSRTTCRRRDTLFLLEWCSIHRTRVGSAHRISSSHWEDLHDEICGTIHAGQSRGPADL